MANSETTVLRELMSALERRLPPGWRADMRREPPRPGPDATLTVRAPDGSEANILVEYKTRLSAGGVPDVLNQLRRYADSYGKPTRPLVAAPFLSPRTRQVLAEAGTSYVDGTGNLRLVLETPALVMDLDGASRDPSPDRQQPLRSLRGRSAGRVVRAVCDFRPPYGVRDLAERSQTPVASVWRVLDLLEREALVTRDPEGGRTARIIAADWANLIRRWTQDYGLTRSNQTELFLAPRGLDDFALRLRSSNLTFAVTGSLAAAQIAPVAAPRLATVFLEDLLSAQGTLDLRPTESGANVLLAEPFDRVAFERTWRREDLVYAALSQVAADLLTSPGRAPAEADALIQWMQENEDAWRT
jgi:hypothetical protein